MVSIIKIGGTRMKKRTIMMSICLLGCLAGSINTWAETFPYKMMIETQDVLEDHLYLTLVNAEFFSEDCVQLEQSVNSWAKERESKMEERMVQLRESAEKDAQELGDAFYGYNVYQQMKVTRADDRVLSLLEEGYEYLGDGAASGYLDGINFDVQSGEILELSHIVNDMEGFQKEAAAYIKKYVDENYAGMLQLSEEQINTLWENGMEWYMNAAGVVVAFAAGTVGGAEYGNIEIPLTFTQFSSFIEEEYFLSDNAGLYQLRENTPAQILDGTEELTVEIQSEQQEYEKEYTLSVSDQTMDMGQFFYLGNMYLLKNEDEKVYVLYDSDTATGDYMTHLYRIGKDTVEKTDEVYGSIDSANSTPGSIEMSLRIYVLGEYKASKGFKVDENGEFAADDGLYVVEGILSQRPVLLTTQNIPAVIDGEETTIKKGSSLQMISTDNVSKAIVYVKDIDKEAELELKKGSDVEYWNNTVGGILEKECVENLPYVE